MATESTILSNIQQAEQESLKIFSPKWKTGARNSEFYGLKHFDSEEYSEIEQKSRYPYQIDRTSHSVNTLLGMQRSARFDIFFNARESGDETRAELYNAVWRYFADLHDFEHIESDVFQDACVSCYGVFGVEKDTSRTIAGDLKVGRVPFDEVMWDTNFRQYNLEDASWLSRFRYYRRNALEKLYPDQADLISKLSTEQRWSQAKSLKDIYIKKEFDLIGVHEFYERGFKNVFMISVDGELGKITQAYKTEEEAAQAIQQAKQEYDVAVLTGQTNIPFPNMAVEPYPIATVFKTEAVYNGILKETEEVSSMNFPYMPYFCYFHDGEFWSVVDRLKDPQLFFDRMFIQTDHWIGTMAKGALWTGNLTPEEQKKVEEVWGKTGGTLNTKKKPEVLASPGPAPQLFSLIDRIEAAMDNSMGGANQLGFKQTASESGRAVLARLQQAGLDHFVPLDNMRRTKDTLGRAVAHYLKTEVTQPRVFRIVGDELTMMAMQQGGIAQYFKPDDNKSNVGYLQVNTEDSNSLEGLEVDIVVDEAGHSPTKNAATLNTLADLGKSGVLTVPPPPEVIINLSDLPSSLKQIWKQSIQAERENAKDPLVKNVSVNYKDLPVDAKLDILNKMGISADATAIVAKEIMDKPHISGQKPEPKKVKSGNSKG